MSENAAEQPMYIDGPQIQELVHPKGIGEQLALHRESLGWTTEQVAQQLNLAPRQIQALEADNHAALPGMASVRGFIRSYSKLLKIDPEPLLAMISGNAATINEPITMRPALSAPFFDDSRLLSRGARPKLAKSALVVALLCVLAGVLYGAHQLGWIPVSPESVTTTTADTKPVVEAPDNATLPAEAVEPKSLAAGGNEPNRQGSDSVTAPVAPVASIVATPVAAPVVTPSAVVPSAAPAAVQVAPAAKSVAIPAPAKEPVASVTPVGNGALAFNFREASWVEIRRVHPKAGSPNNLLVYRLFPAGSTFAFDLTEPATLTVGNAAGVDVSLRGTRLDMDTAKGNVVRLTLQ
jgi:cytoskeleton protein RodZ